MKWLIAAYARRRTAWLKNGALLSPDSARRIQRARWWMPIGNVFFLIIAATDDRWYAIMLFGGIGFAGLFLVTPAFFVMLEGYKRRDEIDTSNAEGFDLNKITAGAVGGVILLPLVKMLEEAWPWW